METTIKKESSAEEILKQTKLCKIEDIFKVKKLLYGFGDNTQIAAITDFYGTFCELYDMELYELEELNKDLCNQASTRAWGLMDKY